MTTRRALLISNPGKEGAENFCKGVFVDIKKYKQFLTSPLGGAWLSSEIVHLDKPTSTQVDAEVYKLGSFGYTFILFTGHGYFSNQTTMLELKENENYDSLNLRKFTTKRTILLDCCRKVVRPERIFKVAMDSAVESLNKRSLTTTECRKYFDKEIENCPDGNIVCYSCVKDEVSGDDGGNGGFYVSSLLEATNNWFKKNDVDLTKDYAKYSIAKAHDAAISLVARLSGDKQHPEITKARSAPYFPFAVMA
ncbi:MAG: caspase family protein [Gammaproteobacteria bacterium]|nr:caspase family protein [Gammaproteobacteria bacterium]